MKLIFIAIAAALLATPVYEYKQAQSAIQQNSQRQVETQKLLDQVMIKRAKKLEEIKLQEQKVKAEAEAQAKAQAEARELAKAGRPPSTGAVGNCEQYRSKIAQYPWDVRTAMAIMEAESTCRYWALGHNTNGTSDGGLFQINSSHCPHLINCDERVDPDKNIAVAYKLYAGRGGWGDWSVYNSGKYRQYLR